MVEGFGGMMPLLITGTSQTGDLLGFISAIKMDGICSMHKDPNLISTYRTEQISPGMY